MPAVQLGGLANLHMGLFLISWYSFLLQSHTVWIYIQARGWRTHKHSIASRVYIELALGHLAKIIMSFTHHCCDHMSLMQMFRYDISWCKFCDCSPTMTSHFLSTGNSSASLEPVPVQTWFWLWDRRQGAIIVNDMYTSCYLLCIGRGTRGVSNIFTH